jgi:hypothetical protein
MPAEKFDADPDLLRKGGESSGYAGAAARRAAARLDESSPARGIFGDFDAAHTFHGALTAGRDEHVQRLCAHDATLRVIASKAPAGARAVTDTDESSADAIGAAGDAIDATDT